LTAAGVEVYRFDGESWVAQCEVTKDLTGHSVSLSSDASVVVVGEAVEPLPPHLVWQKYTNVISRFVKYGVALYVEGCSFFSQINSIVP
jgi:hypothetical protein